VECYIIISNLNETMTIIIVSYEKHINWSIFYLDITSRSKQIGSNQVVQIKNEIMYYYVWLNV